MGWGSRSSNATPGKSFFVRRRVWCALVCFGLVIGWYVLPSKMEVTTTGGRSQHDQGAKVLVVEPKVEVQDQKPEIQRPKQDRIQNGVPADAKTQINLETARKYLKQAEYPPSTRPLRSAAEDPVIIAHEVYPKRGNLRTARCQAPLRAPWMGLEGSEMCNNSLAIAVWPEKLDFVYPEAVVIYAQRDATQDESLKGLELTVEVLPSVGSGQTEKVATARFSQVSENLWQAVLDFPKEKGVGSVGAYTAIVKGYAEAQNSESASLVIGFNVSYPQARLTGNFKDEVKDGSLVIWAQVAVEASGRYYLNGSLYNDGPVAWAENAQQFDPGLHWMPLTFYGKVFWEQSEKTEQEQKSSCSYVLKHLSLARTGIFPNMRAALWTKPYTTHNYAMNQFTNEPYNDPILIETAQRMTQDMEHSKF